MTIMSATTINMSKAAGLQIQRRSRLTNCLQMAFLWQQFKQLCKLHMETLIVVHRKLIHNEVAKACDEFLGGLYELLEEANWYLKELSNDSGEV